MMLRTKLWQGLLLCLAMRGLLDASTLASSVGFYHWSGRHTTSMTQGVEQVASLGGRVARVVLGPSYYTDYNIRQGCYPHYSLNKLLDEPDVKSAMDNPSIEVFVLTAFDGASYSDCYNHHYLNPVFYSPENTAAIKQELSDFTLRLYQDYQHTAKRFIISDWEADNAVYCGKADLYATDPTFRASCDDGYSGRYGNLFPAESIDALKLWYQARQAGIADGRNRAAALGIGGMRVYFAPEVSIVHALHDNGFQSVLYDVLPTVLFDYVSYSAYESINKAGDAAGQLTTDLNTIRDLIGSNAIIIGESGFPRSFWQSEAVTRTDAVMRAALFWGVAYFIQWNLYDQDSQDDFGLFDLDGNMTPLGAYYQSNLSDSWQLGRRGGGPVPPRQ